MFSFLKIPLKIAKSKIILTQDQTQVESAEIFFCYSFVLLLDRKKKRIMNALNVKENDVNVSSGIFKK